jgi:hypothetical protein
MGDLISVDSEDHSGAGLGEIAVTTGNLDER